MTKIVNIKIINKYILIMHNISGINTFKNQPKIEAKGMFDFLGGTVGGVNGF